MKNALPTAGLGLGLLFTAGCYAGLGGDSATVEVDAATLQGAVQHSVGSHYSIAEIVTDSGNRVREYLDGAGLVFAIAWEGPSTPDLKLLLGGYFTTYATALAMQDHLGLRRAARVAGSELVVEAGGHLRAYSGRAYLPMHLPAGTTLTEIR